MNAEQPDHPAAGRPQRTLTTEEEAAVRSTRLSNLIAALIMGIVDPVPSPSPMGEAEGAWVREHVWPRRYQTIEAKYPFGYRRWTHCQRGTCWNCLNNRCDLCIHRQRGGPDVDDNTDWVENARSRAVAKLIVRPDGARCQWWCRCPCPKSTPAAAETDDPSAPARLENRPDGAPAAGGRRGRRPAAPADEAQAALF
ncbi:DUF6248 family natural product biosynthesis protein [Kitasatospora sp. NPDC088548]|uniref:DUF6248 family natural product biosynthesis protein n=1 Tax=Kitasatospora sp. NPDC088548 TaxID=3364075 RepID=UPI003828B833